MTQAHLGLDVTYVSRLVGDRQEFSAHAGDAASFGVDPARGLPIDVTYCNRMVRGDLPNVIPDSSRDARVRDLPATHSARIGAYIGVPLRLSDGTLYGSFCCASHTAQPDLSQRDVKFMEVLAELMVAELETEYRQEQVRSKVLEVIEHRRLEVALQPVVSLVDGSRIGVEALARFPTDVGTPATMFPAATASGLAVELELLAARRALDAIPAVEVDEFLSVNMSPESLREGIRLVERAPSINPLQLVFEITEHQAVDQYDDLRDDLKRLHRMGIRVAIDDAGAGYASMYHIVQLEPDIIKVDRELVDGIAGDPVRRSVIRGFVGLARDIGATVIGEGVEQWLDLLVLRELGVDAAQGYLIGRPTLDHAEIKAGFGTVRLT